MSHHPHSASGETPASQRSPDGAAARNPGLLYDPYFTPHAPPLPAQPEAPVPGGRNDSLPGRVSYGRVPARREPRQRWLFVLTTLGFLSLLSSAAIFAWGVHRWQELLGQQPSGDASESDTKRAAHGTDEPQAQSNPDPAPSPDAPENKVPDNTQSTQIGAVEVVDVGLSAAELGKVLELQTKLARAKGQTMLLMVTGTECAPCRAFDASLTDPKMQQALRHVRLVRVDLRAFKEELGGLKLQINVYPVFALLAPDMTPRDAIHGGEWDEDVADNMAPVLGEFVRGSYRSRRHPDWSPTPGGMRL